MAPVVAALRADAGFSVSVAVTAQHRQMLDQVLALFGIQPEHDLDVMTPGQSLDRLFSTVLTRMTAVLEEARPDLILVHGDTTTTLASAMAAFYTRTPVAHVEAGLRTGDMRAPWPEEANRRLTAPLCALHFAPTPQARLNLLAEGIADEQIHVTGNSVIDTLLSTSSRIRSEAALRADLDAQFAFLQPDCPIILVTGHRRENFGEAMESICGALAQLATDRDVQIVYPVHMNPNVREPVHRLLGTHPGIHLIEPLDYLPFVHLMTRAHLILTDSGGIQEEAPSLGKPVLVLRDATERPEAVASGTVRLVGSDRGAIVRETCRLLDDDKAYAEMATAHNPYGDGHTSTRIAQIVRAWLPASAG